MDYFSDEFLTRAKKQAKIVTEGRVNDLQLIGYFIDNELPWGEIIAICSLARSVYENASSSPGKAGVVDFLLEIRQRHQRSHQTYQS